MIALTNSPAAGPLSGTLTTQVVSGVANFSNLALDTVGSGYTIQAISGGLNPVTTNPINVSAGAASQLVISIKPPSTMVAGFGFGLAFDAEDAFGNLAPTFTGTVSISLANNLKPATLNGPLVVHAVGGVANTHDFYTLDTAQSYNIAASTPGLPTVISGKVNVTPQAATHLAVVTQPPSSVPKGAGFNLVVAAEDQFGNVDPTFSGSVSVAPPAGSGAALGGTTTVSAGAGNATFTGLTLSNATAPVSLQLSTRRAYRHHHQPH